MTIVKIKTRQISNQDVMTRSLLLISCMQEKYSGIGVGVAGET